MADDIRVNGGLRDMIHILPHNKAGFAPGTILDGHRRKEALLRNGETKTTVVVRHDLSESERLHHRGALLPPLQRRSTPAWTRWQGARIAARRLRDRAEAAAGWSL